MVGNRIRGGGQLKSIEAAQNAARIGATVLLNYWRNLGKEDADLKARNDWVSRADRESEQAIISYLAGQFPGDSFLAEEGGTSPTSTSSDRTWVIDPLDGTSNYLQHFPVWSVSIALREKGQVTAGVIYEPLHDSMFAAERGAGAWRDGERMRISSHPGLEGSFLATGFPFRAQKYVGTYTSIFQEVIRQAKGVRRAGSAALDLAYTAAGVFDGFFEMHLAPWDVAAGSLMVEEAGGVVTDFSGGNRFWQRGNILGAAPGVHAALLGLIGQFTTEDDLDR
jgi:myo-inositol-1(or 4)-monophosphatase